jgi:hypothetical protein
MLNHFVWWAFAVGIAVGVVGIYFITPAMTSMIKYPAPQEVDKLIYKDKNGVCYKYTTKDVNCDKSQDKLQPFPLS